jgi:dTDP-glucose 4,6-dehydratase
VRVLVTGGCGFIGSNFVKLLLSARDDAEVVVVDALTYSGNLQNLQGLIGTRGFTFLRADIADRAAMLEAASGATAIVNFAAESHVDRSIEDAAPFIRTNIVGTQVLLEVAQEERVPLFLQISTDEVYGSLGSSGRFRESAPLAPSSPYSASKAAADLLVQAAIRTHSTPALILRSSNAYGPYQFPEKLIPLMITSAMEGRTLPVYGDGLHVRDWIHVEDLARAVLTLLESDVTTGIYNVGGGNERTNLEVVRTIVRLTGADEAQIQFVDDRPGHDRRYAMDYSRIADDLGWRPRREYEQGLAETVEWYSANQGWLDSVRSGDYRTFYDRQYSRRLGGCADT